MTITITTRPYQLLVNQHSLNTLDGCFKILVINMCYYSHISSYLLSFITNTNYKNLEQIIFFILPVHFKSYVFLTLML